MTPPVALPPPVVLIFAATDPTGGAGLQAGLLSASAIGCHALSVITAVAVRDTLGMAEVLPIDAGWVEEQARTLLEDMPVDAFVVGLPGSAENVAAIAAVLADYPDVPVVLDPELTYGRHDGFDDDEMLAALRELLLPQTTVLSVDAYEAGRLADVGDEPAMTPEDSVGRLIELGCEYVLLAGTHTPAVQVLNDLYGAAGRIQRQAWARLPGPYYGAGSTLAAAVGACLAHGLAVPDAVREAQEFTWRALAAGFRPGMGRLIPDRFFWACRGAREENDTSAPETEA